MIPIGTILSGGDDEGGGGGSGNGGGPSRPPAIYMWLSTQEPDGDIGGVNGANGICQSDASGIAGLPGGLTHRAVIGTSSNDPVGYSGLPSLSVRRPVDDAVIINSYTDFFDTSVLLVNVVDTSGDFIWTGLESSGSPTTNHCNDWTTNSSSARGGSGDSDSDGSPRIAFFNSYCDDFYAILCMSY